jgi:hypothetical protein
LTLQGEIIAPTNKGGEPDVSTPTLTVTDAMDDTQLSELVARVSAMTVSELAALPREEVTAWPGDPKAEGDVSRNPRAVRRRKMLSSKRRVKIYDVAEMAGVGRDAVMKWRGANIKTGETNTRAFIQPIALDTDEIDRLARRAKRTGKTPRPSRDFYEGEAWAWLDETDRLDKAGDLYPKAEGRAGRSPSGRPPAQRRPK